MNYPSEYSGETLITSDVPSAYKEGLKNVAQEWRENPHQSSYPAGTSPAYSEMYNEVAHRLSQQEGMEVVGDSLPNRAGLSVISNFFYIGAAKAALQGYSVDELQSALYQPTSFKQLLPLTKESNDAARRIEAAVGLVSYPDSYLGSYTLTPDGLEISRSSYAIASYRAKSQLFDEGRLTSEEAYADPAEARIRCLGMKAGLVTYAYKYLLDICVNDESLFAATIARRQETSQ